MGPDLEEEVSVECSVSNVQAFSTNNEGTINTVKYDKLPTSTICFNFKYGLFIFDYGR